LFECSELRRSLFTVGLGLCFIVPLCEATKLPDAVHEVHAAQKAAQPAPSNLSSAQGRAPGAKPSEAKPLQITYEDGELTIIAENVPLSEVLSSVRKVLGADIDIPASAAGQRLWVRFGPGPARRILRDLLDGTELDYVIQASETDVDGVQSVLLTARGKIPETGGLGNQVARSPNRRAQPVSASAVENSEPESSAPSRETVAASDPTPPIAPPASASTRSAASNVPPAAVDSNPILTSPTAGNWEQSIQQLQNMYQQRRQIQVQQNQKPPVSN
jgi:hypothetical protein